MSRCLVLVLDQVGADLGPETSILAPHGIEVRYASSVPARRRAELSGADGLLLNRTRVDGLFLDAAPKCRVIVTYGTGHDHIDLAAARARDVVVTNVPDYCTAEVADHTMAILLALARGLLKGDALVRAGGWGVEPIGPLHRLAGQTLGLVGFGRIARAVARRAEAFGLRMLVFDPFAVDQSIPPGIVRVPFVDDLLGQADWVSLHAPLNPDTRELINRRSLAVMKPGAFLINTSRGRLVDLEALLEALDTGRLAGAGLDVFPEEPPSQIDVVGRNLLVSPHSAYYSWESLIDLKGTAAVAVAAVLTGGQPVNRLV